MNNKILGTAIIIFVILSNIGNAQPDEVIINLHLSGKPGQSDKVDLEFGLKSGATDTLDKALGEKQIPPFWPPTGLEARMSIFSPSINKDIYSYKDFRGIEGSTTFMKKYYLGVAPGTNRQGDPKDNYKDFYIRWQTLSPYIDSARIQDGLGIIDINMKDSLEALYTNEYIEDLIITVYYNMAPVSNSVQENQSIAEKGITVYPNPAGDELYIGNAEARYSIISVTGEIMVEGQSTPFKPINIEALPNGVYAIKIESKEENIVKRFVKK